ncbi:virion structural protein [Bacillus phage 0305phi8-36]|uniref:virion structural protein n=1 Tax=Bacillus phage 0305phi8-36 TaxID=458639 RepID=UPI00015A1EEA|nr:virion structural protein [Bacillus phage 0305phi8-36]ABS83700.1 virion structural protein [Bacillus phage 0305phi8-36]
MPDTTPNQVKLEDLQSTKLLREYKKSVYEPQGIDFNKRQVDYQLFPEEYFTGTDVFVYFNDLWLDEIVSLSFTLSENVKGIFGYASNTWDYVGRGKRQVVGQFRIAFKEAGYMFAVLDHIGKQGNHKKTAISWIENKDAKVENGIDGVPAGYADVLERIEDALGRIYGDPGAKAQDKSYQEKYRRDFEWNLPMQLGSPNTNMGEPRTSTNQTGQVSQLQQRLIDLGFGFPEAKFNWGKHYAGDSWTGSKGQWVSPGTTQASIDYINKRTGQHLGTSSGDWYVCLRYFPEGGMIHKSIGAKDAMSQFEVQLQKRLDRYPGELSGLNMGGMYGRYDGRYGSGPLKGVQLFQKLAGINDGSQGYYITSQTKRALEAGLKVTGEYDVATRVAVWLYQAKQIASGNPYNIREANGIVDKETLLAMGEDSDRTVVVPGENRYKPTEMAEHLYATYEREVWGRPFVERAENVRREDSFFYRSRRNENGDRHLESLSQNGFDIYINYGPLPQYIQNKLNKLPDGGSFNTTVKAIRNVQLTDVQQVIDANTGQPIEEIYSFVAKDLD